MKKQFVLAVGVLGLLVFSARASGDIMTIVLSSADETNAPYPSSTNILIGGDSVVDWGAVNCNVTAAFPDTPGSTNFTRKIYIDSDSLWAGGGGIRTIAGPVVIMIHSYRRNGGFCTLKITKQAGTFTPSTAVVIPSDAQGPVDILLESSTNLVQWTQALPGTYGTSSQLRYFRVRAVQK